MPNWCSCSLVIEGDIDKIARLKKDLTEPVYLIGSESSWLPKVSFEETSELKSNEEKKESFCEPYHNAAMRTLQGLTIDYDRIGYHEMIEVMLGCKWDFNLDALEEDNNKLVYCFQTAWNPPKIWAMRMALKYKVQVVLEFEESGNGFAGICEINGVEDSFRAYESDYYEYRLADIGDIDEWIELHEELHEGMEGADEIIQEARDSWALDREAYKENNFSLTCTPSECLSNLKITYQKLYDMWF